MHPFQAIGFKINFPFKPFVSNINLHPYTAGGRGEANDPAGLFRVGSPADSEVSVGSPPTGMCLNPLHSIPAISEPLESMNELGATGILEEEEGTGGDDAPCAGARTTHFGTCLITLWCR